MELTIEDQIIVAVRQITHAVDLWSKQLWRRSGLTSPQLAVLREVQEGRHVTPTMIAEALHLSQPTVTGILQRLEREGAIRRVRSQTDRRSICATVTPKGKALAAKCPSLLRDRVRDRLARLPKNKRAELLQHVQLLAETMDAPAADCVPFLSGNGAPPTKGEAHPRRRRRPAGRQEDK
ncbi:MAG: MarR family winged helix-turn-helix transcriptional regulator [Pirellulales bacterium]